MSLQARPFVDAFTACDLWTECMGSDHCPVWATLDVPAPQLPQGFLAPALSTSHTHAGADVASNHSGVIVAVAVAFAAMSSGTDLRALHHAIQNSIWLKTGLQRDNSRNRQRDSVAIVCISTCSECWQ